MNMVGTPCSAVQRSAEAAVRVVSGSKPSPGNTMPLADATQVSTPSTMPKQWYSGTGMHSRSCSPSRIATAIARALFTTLVWVSVAPFGRPVVPLV